MSLCLGCVCSSAAVFIKSWRLHAGSYFKLRSVSHSFFLTYWMAIQAYSRKHRRESKDPVPSGRIQSAVCIVSCKDEGQRKKFVFRSNFKHLHVWLTCDCQLCAGKKPWWWWQQGNELTLTNWTEHIGDFGGWSSCHVPKFGIRSEKTKLIASYSSFRKDIGLVIDVISGLSFTEMVCLWLLVLQTLYKLVYKY